MIVLGIDLTAEHGSIAVVRDKITLAEDAFYSTDGFGHFVFERVQALLRAAGVALLDIDCFAAAMGPGSFTGVRVGLAMAKGFAEATGKPAAAVSNLRALASLGSAVLRAPVIDARRGDVYTAVYNDRLEMVVPETVGKLDAFLAKLGDREVEIISPGAPVALAAAVARCAVPSDDVALLDANYVRRSDAESYWHDRQENK